MSSRGKILIVDDDPDIRMTLGDYLTRETFEVRVASTAEEALQKTSGESYDVVLLDVGLPDRNGLAVLQDLSHQCPHLPVILLTAFPSLPKTADPGILKKAFACLTKPYSREEINITLQRAFLARMAAVGPGPSAPFSDQEQPTPPFSWQSYADLTQHYQLMQSVLDHLPEAVLIAGPDKRFRFANRAACDSLGYTRDELLSLRIPDIAPNHNSDRFRQNLTRLRSGEPLSYVSLHRAKDGHEFPIHITVHLLSQGGQQFTCAVVNPLSSPEPQTLP